MSGSSRSFLELCGTGSIGGDGGGVGGDSSRRGGWSST